MEYLVCIDCEDIHPVEDYLNAEFEHVKGMKCCPTCSCYTLNGEYLPADLAYEVIEGRA